jgi:hypothetical protein
MSRKGTQSRVSALDLDIHAYRKGIKRDFQCPRPSVKVALNRWFIHENVLGVKELVTSTSSLSHSGAATATE